MNRFFVFLKKYFGLLIIDSINFIKFQSKSINKYSIAYVNPNKIKYSTRFFSKKENGYLNKISSELPIKIISNKLIKFISDGDWDKKIVSLDEVQIINRTKKHFLKNKSWRSVGEIDWMLKNIKSNGIQDNCKNLEDIKKRLKNLDNLKIFLENGGKFKSPKEVNSKNIRGTGGIGIAIDRNGEIIWMGGGGHRLAIAQVLKLREIPVFIKLIHTNAIINMKIRKNLKIKNTI